MHHIKHFILTKLSQTESARFRDMRPPRVDSNAYSYHLKAVQKEGLVEKDGTTYRLSPKGLSLVDRLSRSQLTVREQPKILTMVVVRNKKGQVLLTPRRKQPFINSWTIANGSLHMEDGSIETSAKREVEERLRIKPNDTLTHRTDAYIYAHIDGQLVSAVLAHVFSMEVESEATNGAMWTDKTMRKDMQLVPALEDIIGLATESTSMTFREYSVEWTRSGTAFPID